MAYKVGTPQIDTAVGIGLIPDGTTDNASVISSYIAEYTGDPTKQGTLEFSDGVYRTTGDASFPENLKVIFSGGQLLVENTKTVTFLGPVEGMPYAFNVGDGGFVIAGPQDHVLPQWWGIVGDGTTDNMTELGYLATSLASTQTKVVFQRGTYVFNSGASVVLGHNVDVEILPGALLQAENSTDITFSGELTAGPYQVFNLVTSGVFRLLTNKEVLPEWWGAVADSTTDCSTAFSNCLLAIPRREGVWSNGAYLKTSVTTTIRLTTGRWNNGSPETGYRFDSAVTIPDFLSVHIEGGKRHGARLINNTGGDWILQFNAAYNSFQWRAFSVSGVIFDDGGLRMVAGLSASNQGGVRIEDCTFYNTPEYAIEVGTRYVWGWIARCTFDGCAGGIHFNGTDSDLWTIEESTFLREHTYPSVMIRSSGITVYHCDFEVRAGGGLTQPFIAIQNPATDCRILENRFGNEPDHPISAIEVGEVGDDTSTGILAVIIRGNQFKGDGVPGPNIAEAAIRMHRPLQRSEITHNYFWSYTTLIDDDYANQASQYARYSYDNVFSDNQFMFWDSRSYDRTRIFVNGGSGWACTDHAAYMQPIPESLPINYLPHQDLSTASYTKNNCTVAQDVEGPDGVAASAWTMTRTAGGSCYLLSAATSLSTFPRDRPLVLSVWAKAGTATGRVIRLTAIDAGNRSINAFNNPIQVTDEWRLYQEVCNVQTSADTVRLYIYSGADGTSETTGTVLLADPRVDFGDQAHVPAVYDPEKNYVDLQDHVVAANVAGNTYTSAFTRAIARGTSMGREIRIPNGTWPVQDVDPLHGMSIVCDRGASIQALGGSGAIFLDAGGGLKLISITGGSWSNCDYVLQRTNTSSMLHSRFTNMSCSADTIAFEMESSIQNVWQGCTFSGVGSGIQFNSATQSNINTIRDCQFQNITTGKGVISVGVVNPNAHLSIKDCWFEQISNGCIELEGSIRNTHIESCYFEGNGSAGAINDIEFHTDGGGQGRQLVVANCQFANPNASQTGQRISLRGQTHAVIRNNVFNLNAAQNAINYAVSNVYVSEFWNNYLNATGGGAYKARLFDDSSTNDPHYSTFPSSGGGVTGSGALTYFSGASQADNLRPFSDTVSTFTGAGTAVVGRINQVDPSGGAFTLDLPTGRVTGERILIKNTSTSATAVTIDGNGNDIDGASTFEFAKVLGAIEFVWDGSEWNLIRNDPPQTVFSPTTAEASAVLVSGDQEFGATATWPAGEAYAKAVVTTNDVHVRFTANEYEVLTFDDVILTHGAFAGGDSAVIVGNYVRGLTSTAVGIIKEVVDSTHTRIAYETGSAVFDPAETINETTTGLAGGDTGDAATTSSVDLVPAADGVLYTADTDGEIIYNEDPATNTSISFRSGTGAFSVELFPVQQQ